jgi:predicted NBD/HSP70 family sugar kinase
MRAVNPMVEDGILHETAVSSGGRGKPATLLEFRPGALLTVGISLALDRVRVRVCDLAGTEIAAAETARIYDSAAAQLADLDGKIDAALAEVSEVSRIVGVGVSVQGYFLEIGARFTSRADPAGWAEVDLQAHLSKRFGLPVRIMNDGKTITTSLMSTTGSSDFLCIHIGSGIGGGIVLNGALIGGTHGNAGEVGPMFPMGANRPTEPNFLAAAGRETWEGWSGIDALDVSDHQSFRTFLSQSSEQIAHVIGTALALLDFSEVYLCSRMPPDVLEALCDQIDVAPLGADLVGASTFLSNGPPMVIPRHIPNHARLACRMALEAFLSQTDLPIG